MNPSNGFTIGIRPPGRKRPRKITTIYGLKGDGFSICVPYHKAQTGCLFKHPVIPNVPQPSFVGWEKGTVFAAQDKVRLNYHTDGFVEFSGHILDTISSGRDLISGDAKGLALFSSPLTRPGFSSPCASVSVYGLDEFETAEKQGGLIIFEPSDFYYRKCTPESANFWTLTIYAFPKNVAPPIRYKQKRLVLDVAIEPLNGPISSVTELAAVFLAEENLFLGLYINCWKAQLESASGWVLNGPGDFTADRRGHTLMGIFPRTKIPKASSEAPRKSRMAKLKRKTGSDRRKG